MDNVLLTVLPIEQLRTFISEAVGCEFSKRFADVQPENQSPELLTRKEAAKLLSISLPTLLDFTKSGKITGYRLGTRVRYKRSELEQSLTQIQSVKSKGGNHGTR
ncbi:helix-turn-helix domain-containing protein [Chitinophaga arvensicola]|uniref:DNA binding domain-containing protein, excisionase family n=1 Tax=Chitinophaga arvensicola TaxID=29529 RepID=A0A1I0QIT0_9BACT|nr:helix-turn-helix domain-containing protein [Chitinophaga arvensicola]SEW27094.1 DNA binding domain-containing protein, excisionase family [Chitinophaga arvensicola]